MYLGVLSAILTAALPQELLFTLTAEIAPLALYRNTVGTVFLSSRLLISKFSVCS